MRSAICTEALALVLVFLVAAPARAQEVDGCADLRVEAPDPVRLEHGGVAGMWFPMPTARLMLCEVRELRVRRREVALSDAEITLWERRVSGFEERLQLAVQARNELATVLEAAERRAREATEHAEDPWRSPVLWFAVGVLAAVLLAGAGALLLAEIS